MSWEERDRNRRKARVGLRSSARRPLMEALIPEAEERGPEEERQLRGGKTAQGPVAKVHQRRGFARHGAAQVAAQGLPAGVGRPVHNGKSCRG